MINGTYTAQTYNYMRSQLFLVLTYHLWNVYGTLSQSYTILCGCCATAANKIIHVKSMGNCEL